MALPDDPHTVAPVAPAIPAGPPLEAFVKAIGDPLRWAILEQLGSGEPRMVLEIARALRKPPTLISKHLAVLRKGGAVERKQRLYRIPRHYVTAPGDGVVDYGHCVLRLKREG